MKRSKQSVPGVQTGDAASDGGSSSTQWLNKGGRNATTEASRRAAGQLAPKPAGGAALLGNDRPSHPTMGSMARVQNRPSSPTGKMPTAGSFTPVQNNANANLTGQATGQAEVLPRGNSARVAPATRTSVTNNPVAAAKPKRKGIGSAFFGEY